MRPFHQQLYKKYLLGLLMVLASRSVVAVSIDVEPSIFSEITSAQLPFAGGDFSTEMYNLTQPWQLQVSDTNGAAWQVYIHQVTSDWPLSVDLRIRTDTGPWLNVDQTEKLLISGAGDRNDITVFFSVANATVSGLSVGSYHVEWQYRIEINE